MVRLISAILPLLLVFSLTSCKEIKPDPKEPTVSGEATPENVMPEVDTEVVPPESTDTKTPTATAKLTPEQIKHNKIRAGVKIQVRNQKAAKELKKRFALEPIPVQGALKTLNVSVNSDGKFESIHLYGYQISDKFVTFISELDSFLVHVGFGDCVITDEQIGKLSNLKNLKSVHFSNVPITGTGLRVLDGSDKIESLGLTHCGGLTNENVPLLINLTELSLLDSKMITDASIPKLGAMKKLKSLNIYGTGISAEGLAKLKELLPNCKIIK